MKANTCKTTVILIIIFMAIMIRPLSYIFAQTSSSTTVNATVKLSVCGDSTVEGSEDCEGSDLNGKSCTTQGYSSGSLSCDIACSFDTSLCIAPTATPTPTPTNTPTPTLTPTPTSSSKDNSSPTATPTPLVATITSAPTPIQEPTLPTALQIFDINGIGKILTSDLPQVVKLWVDEWKQALISELNGTASTSTKKCDVNRDKSCDMTDFSVLMYYIDR